MFIFIFLLIFLSAQGEDDFEMPLAPYNVKLMCRQGRRYTKQSQSPIQCPSASTSCGFFEFNMKDSRSGYPLTGVYDCIDGGILREDSAEEDFEEESANVLQNSFVNMCGAVPKCTKINLDQLNKAFVKYIVQEYDIKLEGLEGFEIKLCCAMFHSTLQRLINSEKSVLLSSSAVPVMCQGTMCQPGAVGCLLHSKNDFMDYDERRKRKRRLALNDYIEDEDDYAVELDFGDLEINLITKPPTTQKPTLPSLKLPMFLEDDLTTSTTTTTTTTTTTFHTPTTSQKKEKIFDYSKEEEENEPQQETHCVYRHLNDELYRYCLLVYQNKDGDRCYHHQGHTICCCFVAPDKETCDPTEIELIVKQSGDTPMERVVVTAVPPTTTTTSTTTTTTSTTTTTTEPTTTEAITTTTKYPTLPPQIYRRRPIDQMKKRKGTRKKCRVAYIRTKSGSRTRPMLVCDNASSSLAWVSLMVLTVFASILL